jgi:hypothetical protein
MTISFSLTFYNPIYAVKYLHYLHYLYQKQYFHQYDNLILVVEILQPLVEILLLLVEIRFYNTSTRRSSDIAPFDKISKSGDSGHGHSGDTL